MKLIRLDSQDAYFNMATEEYLFQRLDQAGAYFLLWQNKSAVVVGSHQNMIEEINLEYANEAGIQVARRLSGGGAVFHDLGNLNYSVLVHSDEMRWDIKRMADPVVDTLTRLGVDVGGNQRNDLLIDGKKISGSSQFIKGQRLLHHGTLLFCSDLNVLSNSLKARNDRIESRSIKSVRSKVTNIVEHYPGVTVHKFISELTDVLRENSHVEEFELSSEDMEAISRLNEEKYATWEWIYGKSPEFIVNKQRQVDQGDIKMCLVVKNGIIQSLKIENDGRQNTNISQVESTLSGVKLSEGEIKKALGFLRSDHLIQSISVAELAKAIAY